MYLEKNFENVSFPASETITSLTGSSFELCLAFSVFKSKGKFNKYLLLLNLNLTRGDASVCQFQKGFVSFCSFFFF